jgi:transcription elongation factor GreA
MSQASYMTEEGLAKLKRELEQLTSVERPAISQQIAEARDKGDLSENAEYDAAKEAQGLLEMKIAKLEDMVANARIIDESKINTAQVQILNRVKIKNTKNNQQMEYMLVSESESDIKNGKDFRGHAHCQGFAWQESGRCGGHQGPFRTDVVRDHGDFPLILSSMASIFSKILAGEIPSYRIFEDERLLCFSGYSIPWPKVIPW